MQSCSVYLKLKSSVPKTCRFQCQPQAPGGFTCASNWTNCHGHFTYPYWLLMKDIPEERDEEDGCTEGVNLLYILLITSLHVYLLRTSWTPSFEFLIEASLCRYDRFNYWPLTNQLNHHPFPCLKIEAGTEIPSCSDCQLPIGPCLRCCFPVAGGVCYGAVETLGPR